MEANELRIGNYVLHPSNEEIVLTIDRNSFQYNRGLANIEDFRPIIITKERLLKLGFKKQYSKAFDIYDIYRVYIDENKIEFWILDRDYVEIIYCKVSTIKYIHQLQNLIFDITGKELTYND